MVHIYQGFTVKSRVIVPSWVTEGKYECDINFR